MAPPPPPPKTHRDVPEHLFHTILHRLPFKCLNKLKCISKNTYSLISHDAKFAADQSRSMNTSSSGFVYMTHSGILSFFPDPSLIGVPDPSLNFLNPTSPTEIKLVTTTNGLLLLYGEFSGMKSLCVCNPAIKEMAFVPYATNQYVICELGLAYDPSELPDKYIIVDPLVNRRDGVNLYRFKVFHSDTGKWIRSSQRVFIRTDYLGNKAVCTKGVIYWRCGNFLLWYDTKRDLAGSLALPVVEGSSKTGTYHVEVYAGEITFCRVLSGGIEVWRLIGSHWERLHVASWDSMMDAFDFCHGMQLHHKIQSDMLFWGRSIRPVGFDGRFVYIVVRLKSGDNTEKLFGWDTKTGQVEEKGLITANVTQRTFKYANNMARVPQILNGSSN